MAKPIFAVQMQGIDRIKRALASLGAAAANRILRKGVTAGIQIYAKAMKVAAPKETGLLKKSIGHKVKTYRIFNEHVPAHYTPSKNAGKTTGYAGPRTGFKREVTVKLKNKKGRTVGKRQEVRDPIRYAHLVEKHKPWMKPTFVNQRAAVDAAAMAKMRAEVSGTFRAAAAVGLPGRKAA
jgi:hypothetical protein